MKAIRRATVIALTSAAMLAGSSALIAAPAQAYPQDCSTYTFTGSYGQSYCAYGSGSHRVRVTCARAGQQNYYKYGPWVGTGSVSRAYCNARSSTVQKQGD